MKILAIDASTKSSGVAIFEDTNLIHYDCYSAASRDLIKRIRKMVDSIDNLISNNKDIKVLVLEEVHPEKYAVQNLQTQRALYWLQAAIAFMIHDKYPQIEIFYMMPSHWRSQCGIQKGHSKRGELKKAGIELVKKHYEVNTSSDDIADAICLGRAYILENTRISAW